MSRDRIASPQTLKVLNVLHDAPAEWHYGYDLSKRTGLRSGTLYPILARLADRGLLESRWQEPQRPGRPPRHAYQLTDEGLRVARDALVRASATATRSRPSVSPATGFS